MQNYNIQYEKCKHIEAQQKIKEKVLQKLKNDEDYYGEFGNQFLSNSHVGRLLKDPLNAFEPSKPSPAFLIGGYFHTCILEPDKLEKFKVTVEFSQIVEDPETTNTPSVVMGCTVTVVDAEGVGVQEPLTTIALKRVVSVKKSDV